MLPSAQALIAELELEAPITRRVLERLPADGFDWQPHPKSMTAGQLAHHIAATPGNAARLVQLDGVDFSTRRFEYPSTESKDALLATLDASVAAAREALLGLDDARAGELWRMTYGDRQLAAMPRINVMRMIGLNHWYHHRGELVVYLRLMGVPVPIVYGRSADESPFPQPTA
ncbi:MAG TPA: DinB family protein [Vicinamibacterales bacterium]|nr:DinB family protein [Vicinamibacterales bacterium]